MKICYITLNPVNLSIKPIIYDNETGDSSSYELGNYNILFASTISNFCIEKGVDELIIIGNNNYTQRIKENIISYQNTKFNEIKFKIVLQES